MKARDLLVAHETRIARLEKALGEMARRVRELEDDDLNFELSADERGGPVHQEPESQAASERGAEPASEEPPVSMAIGGSTPEQKAAYKAFVEAKSRAAQRAYGLVEEGNDRVIERPTERQYAMRRQLAREIGWEHWTRSEEYDSDPLPTNEAVAAYLAGGPLWLVHYDRDFVKQQTMATRQRMVADVMETSIQAANELSADILKYEESNDPSVATDAAEADWAANG